MWEPPKPIAEGSGANIRTRKSRRKSPVGDYAAITAVQIAGTVVGRPDSFPTLNWCFLIFAASSIPLMGRRCMKAFKAQHRSDPLFHAAMVLFNSIIKIIARTDPDSLRHFSFCLEFPYGPM